VTGNDNSQTVAQLLIDAVERADVRELRELLRQTDSQFVDTVMRNGWPLLFLAKEPDVLDVLRALLEYGADPNARGPDGYHMLHFSQSKFIDEVSLLLESGADIDAELTCGETPLYSAIRSLDAPLVQFFIDRGADIEHSALELGMTPLHQAVFTDFGTEVPEILLNAGASPNSRAKNGMTPLSYAAISSPRLVKLLLRFGADPAIRDDAGLNAFDTALCFNRDDIAKILVGWTKNRARKKEDNSEWR